MRVTEETDKKTHCGKTRSESPFEIGIFLTFFFLGKKLRCAGDGYAGKSVDERDGLCEFVGDMSTKIGM